jgi:hypothetical protein
MSTGTENGQPIQDPLHRYQYRHPGTQHAMRLLVPNKRLGSTSRSVATIVWEAAGEIVEKLEDGPELSAGLHKLLEAKDCLVRQRLLDEGVI